MVETLWQAIMPYQLHLAWFSTSEDEPYVKGNEQGVMISAVCYFT